MTDRLFNFNPGPSTLPLPVLEEARENIVEYGDEGMSILEMSHRSGTFDEIIKEAERNLMEVMEIPEDYKVLFLQGGASLQFAMVPYNLMSGAAADYVNTGAWSKKAIKEAKTIGGANVVASSEETNFDRVPRGIKFNDDASYAHITSNNTIFGTQWAEYPSTPSPLVADMSSDIMSRRIDVSRFGLIYAGAQKNLGPAGVTLAIIRKDLIERCPETVPIILRYKTHAEKDSLYNTPPTFAIYIIQLVLRYIMRIGGIEEIERINTEKTGILYEAIDSSEGFYRGTAEKDSRSMMNVTFRLPDEDLEKRFVAEALTRKLHGLKGHRSVGGIRASIYNAMPLEGVERLVEFMADFRKNRG